MCTKKRIRRFIPMECNHVYQRSIKGYNIFYDREDYLICYMILSVISKKLNVKILEVCFMFDHIHILIDAESRELMASFVRDFLSVFVREYNTSIGRKGQLFYKSFGSAPKQGNKKMRSVIVYIGNNPVEKHLCEYAEEYRWNFLRYMVEPFPFSNETPGRKRSRNLNRCIKRVNAAAKVGRYMNYTQLYDMFSDLTEMEAEYLTDYIIMTYYPFDTGRLLNFYDDWKQMMDSMHSTTGSEHDIVEEWYSRSDSVYSEMIKFVKGHFMLNKARDVTVMPLMQKKKLMADLMRHTGATFSEICKFLHLDTKVMRQLNT